MGEELGATVGGFSIDGAKRHVIAPSAMPAADSTPHLGPAPRAERAKQRTFEASQAAPKF